MLTRYFPNFFDRILVDAPCSGDGIVRKDRNMLTYWSPQDAQHLAQQQKGLLRAAYQMLRPGGTLVYSTCSLSLEENEEVLLGLLRRYKEDVAILPIAEFAGPPLPDALAAQFPAEFARCIRVWPHHHDTEGAFVARLSKRAPTPSLEDAPDWDTSTTDPAAAESRRAIEDRWNGTLPCPSDQIFTLSSRHLCRQPSLGPGHPRASAPLRPQRHEGGSPPQGISLPKSTNRRYMGESHAGTQHRVELASTTRPVRGASTLLRPIHGPQRRNFLPLWAVDRLSRHRQRGRPPD